MLTRWIKEKLQKAIAQAPAVALLGARQAGKTTLAKTIAKETNSIYLNLEAPEDWLKLREPASFLSLHSDKLVILDEIQRLPGLFTVLRGLIDKGREQGRGSGRFLLLGSVSGDWLRQTSKSLAGRISYVEMGGLNALEVGYDQPEALQTLWLRGGFPESYLARDNGMAMDWLEDLIRTYLERDTPQVGFQMPAARLRRLWTMLAYSQGEPINTSNLASSLEVKRPTVNRYVDIFTGLLLVRCLEPWHADVKKRLLKSPLYYIRDSGVYHRLLEINDYDALLSDPALLSKSWEGFVIENIHSVLPNRTKTYFYHTAAGAKIDLVIKMPSSEIWAVEIKYGTASNLNVSKHYGRTCDDVGATHRYILYGDDEFQLTSDITVISLPRLMKKLQSDTKKGPVKVTTTERIYSDFKSCVEAAIDVEGVRDQEFLVGKKRKSPGKYGVFARFYYNNTGDNGGPKIATITSDSRVQPLISAAKDPHLQLIEEPSGRGGRVALRIPDQHKAERLRRRNGGFKVEVYIYCEALERRDEQPIKAGKPAKKQEKSMKIYPDFKSCVAAEIDIEGIRDQEFLRERNPSKPAKSFAEFCYQNDEYGEVVVTIRDDSRVEPLISAAKDPNLRLIEEPIKTQIALRIPDQYKARRRDGNFKIEVYMYFPKSKK